VGLDVASEPATTESTTRSKLSAAVTLTALGVVFGDIGTSPLYTLKTCFTTSGTQPSGENVLGIVSALVWTLILVVCVKYASFVMAVDYRGEGGILALLARLMPVEKKSVYVPLTALTVVGIVGAAALFGDGAITPAISVLSALEGLGVVTPAAVTLEVPLTIVILIGLFVIQSRGTERIGVIFGPVMGAWFAAIAVAGAVAIAKMPAILAALDPRHAIAFVTTHGLGGFLVFGATILCVTGAEALYADMSHFGRKPILIGWYAVVFPALVFNYLGQGAVVLTDPHALDNAFYALTPGWTAWPMIALATAATVIASQALITGAYTLAEQAIALDIVPRMRVIHTSNRYPGQVFVPAVNVLLALGCIALVAAFRTSDALAAAYGLAVSLTMLATSILFFAVVRRVLKWNAVLAWGLLAFFVTLDGSFVLAGLAKIPAGGWIPLTVAAGLTFLATTWYDGHRRLVRNLASYGIKVDDFLAEVRAEKATRVDGTAVYLTANPNDVPFILHHHYGHVQALHDRIVLMTLIPVSEPYVDEATRVNVERITENFIRVRARFGFMEAPELRPIIASCGAAGLKIDDEATSFVTAAPQVVRASGRGMFGARRWLFGVMLALSRSLPKDLAIPANRLVQLGVEVEM
jgi:KUP system potassium uptake protein